MTIAENFKSVHKSIAIAAKQWGRAPHDINLVAVSKNQPAEHIKAALDTGHRLFGENRVQEAAEHWGALKPIYPDLKLHLIGPLQTNKIKDALDIFDCIETIDREKLAQKLGSALKDREQTMPNFIQVNIGEEPQKSGIIPSELAEFLTFCIHDCVLDIQGLMCIPPANEPASLYFALLQKLARIHNLPQLSMGMSADYEKAIPLGATYIRVGTGIFGARI